MEVLLVILILGMLATVAVVVFRNIGEGAKEDTTRLLVATEIPKALDMFNFTVGRYPTTEEGLNALLVKPAFTDDAQAVKWKGPYIKELPKDQWGHEIHYEFVDTAAAGGQNTTAAAPFHVWSDGPDGQSGSADDIKSWKDETAK
jgi:general secretion pathway protein G